LALDKYSERVGVVYEILYYFIDGEGEEATVFERLHAEPSLMEIEEKAKKRDCYEVAIVESSETIKRFKM
jgi:hypothetical protein